MNSHCLIILRYSISYLIFEKKIRIKITFSEGKNDVNINGEMLKSCIKYLNQKITITTFFN